MTAVPLPRPAPPPVAPKGPAELTYTFDEYVKLRLTDNYELVDGHLVETQMGFRETFVQARIGGDIDRHARANGLGFASIEGLYRFFPDRPNTGRKPDVSFVAAGRITDEEFIAGWLTIAPDLAVEVVSPNDSFFEVERKVSEYLTAGVRLVWVVNAELRAVGVRRRDGTTALISGDGVIDGEDVLPGLSIPLVELFRSVPVVPRLVVPDDVSSTDE